MFACLELDYEVGTNSSGTTLMYCTIWSGTALFGVVLHYLEDYLEWYCTVWSDIALFGVVLLVGVVLQCINWSGIACV